MQADDDKSGLHSLWLQPEIVQAFIYLTLIPQHFDLTLFISS